MRFKICAWYRPAVAVGRGMAPARRLYVQRREFSTTEHQRQRGKKGISYALPAPVNRNWHCIEQKEVRNHRFRRTLATFLLWKVARRKLNKPLG